MVESHKNENSDPLKMVKLAIFEVQTSVKSIAHKILFFSSCKICTLENCIENFTMVQIQSLVRNLKLKKVNDFTEISKFLQKFTPKNFNFSDPRNNEIETNHGDRVKRSNNKKPSPPPSQFQHLGPSKNRYTLLHDEF